MKASRDLLRGAAGVERLTVWAQGAASPNVGTGTEIALFGFFFLLC